MNFELYFGKDKFTFEINYFQMCRAELFYFKVAVPSLWARGTRSVALERGFAVLELMML